MQGHFVICCASGNYGFETLFTMPAMISCFVSSVMSDEGNTKLKMNLHFSGIIIIL